MLRVVGDIPQHLATATASSSDGPKLRGNVARKPWPSSTDGHSPLTVRMAASWVAGSIAAALVGRRCGCNSSQRGRRHGEAQSLVVAMAAQEGGGNPWRDDPKAALEEALKVLETQWSLLELEVEDMGSEPDTRKGANLLGRSALDRMRPFCVPSDYIDIPPLPDAYNHLQACLGMEAGLVMNFLSGNQNLSAAGKMFWQAELYLRRVHEVAGEEDVMESTEKQRKQLEAQSMEMQQAIRGSVLLARQNFISTARFGYFLARAKRRWDLEKRMGGLEKEVPVPASATNEPVDSFIAALKEKVKEVAPLEDPRHNFEVYLGGLDAEVAVELVRPATEEASQAIVERATYLFGTEQELSAELNAGRPSQMELSPGGRQRLNIEAASFGAALFEAEDTAAKQYSHLLTYTTFGSRSISGT
mmetsp:Transcript_59609/g.141836  ORF Transcript_59609/g.141836 Transcript_59609/m.141836 type:complete len:417 (+) Transcript_59609:71-1321(+)